MVTLCMQRAEPTSRDYPGTKDQQNTLCPEALGLKPPQSDFWKKEQSKSIQSKKSLAIFLWLCWASKQVQRWHSRGIFIPTILLQPLLISRVSAAGGAEDTAKAHLEDISESIKKIPLNYSEHCRQLFSASEGNVETWVFSPKAKDLCLSLALHEPTEPQCRIGSRSWIPPLGKPELSYCSVASGIDSMWMGE